MPMRLRVRSLVTGGIAGIGRATAHRFAQAGARGLAVPTLCSRKNFADEFKHRRIELLWTLQRSEVAHIVEKDQ